MLRLIVRCAALWLLSACVEGGDASDAGATDAIDAGTVEGMAPPVEIGVPDDVTGLAFMPLELSRDAGGAGGQVPLESFGQGGTHASLAVRCRGFGNRVFVDVTIENLETGATVTTPPSSRAPLLLCREEDVCDLIPLQVLTGGLADPADKDGLPIRITAEVHTEEGLTGSGSAEGILTRR